MKNAVVYNLSIAENSVEYTSSIEVALLDAERRMDAIDIQLAKETELIKDLTPDCDYIDYALAISSGALCGIIDIFLVGKPGKSILGNITDKWYEDVVESFAKFCKWDSQSGKTAIKYLEEKFDIPYDQRGAGDSGSKVFGLTPSNHHFKSLGHNPSLLGLVFSIMNQFQNTSSFVTNGELITLSHAKDQFELKGHNVPSKIFCGFVNWFGHLISDISGSSSSTTRGKGIPSPLWTWTNDVIAIKANLGILPSDFDRTMNELALNIYTKGYDARFQSVQAIPVLINELLVRLFYSTRRCLHYLTVTNANSRNFNDLWKSCEPFMNVSAKRMLTLAHGSFCALNLGDAAFRGLLALSPTEMVMRVNIVGVGRFTISLYGEASRELQLYQARERVYSLDREKTILEDYMDGLNYLAVLYDDKELLTFVDDLRRDKGQEALQKTVELAKKRNVSEKKVLKNLKEIDDYFGGDSNN